MTTEPTTSPEQGAAPDELLDAKQVATRLQVHVSTVYRLADGGYLSALRTGRGAHRRRGFRCWASVVDAYLRDSEITNDEVA